jgi:hypothetical protein
MKEVEEICCLNLKYINQKFLPIKFLILQNPSASHGLFNAECQARKSFLPDLSSFLRNSSYKRAIFLVNIPDLIYLEEKVNKVILVQLKRIIQHNKLTQTYPTGKRFHLVVENIFITKKCRQLSPSFLQVIIPMKITQAAYS